MGRLFGSTILIFLGLALPSVTGATATDGNDLVGSFSSLDDASSSCNFTTLFYTRSTWSGVGEPCNQKLPFEFWIYMKAEGSAGDPDADHVRNECLLPRSIGMVELITPEDWNTTIMDAAPGQLLRETKRAACYLVKSPLDFEAMCTDDQVTKVSRINAVTAKTRGSPPRMLKRRLQDTLSVARIAHGVDVLISGLEELGCQRTTGEDQTLCIMSDSLNRLGNLATLQESGDLPPDEFLTIVEELPEEDASEPTDEGSAMMELAYDIASGANFKFNTFAEGSMAATDDIITLASDEACDIMVDDVGFPDQPGFRDGIIAEAVNEVVADGTLYFSSAGNSGNGFKFTSNWECASDLFGDVTLEPCDSGVASHVFNPDATGIERYLLPLSGDPFSGNDFFILHWDDDEGTSRGVTIELWIIDVSGTEASIFGRYDLSSDFGTAVISVGSPDDMPDQYVYFITISQNFTDLEDVEMRLLSRPGDIFSDFSDGSVYGHKCATSIISVAAMNIAAASGVDGRFTDPEPSSVELFSSRGPCYINSGSGLEERLKPVTTAANRLETSTSERFETFQGTSAAAPVAAAIATIVRAACYPREVTFTDMMEMLTDYTYTIDVTSDADGEEETWGVEAGYGIISADQMLGWIAANCQESCPGAATPSPSVPTPAPFTTPTTEPPTTPPVSPPTVPPTSPPSVSPTTPPVATPTAPPTTPPITPPTMPPVAPPTALPIVPPTTPPVAPPTAPPIVLPTTPPVAPPTAPPIVPPTTPPVAPPTAPPIVPPTTPPVAPPTAPPIVPPTNPPVAPPTAQPIVSPTTPPVAPPTRTRTTPPITMPPIAPPISLPTMPTTQSLVDASERTSVTVTANAYDTRTTGLGCPPDGCVAANTRDGDLFTRWSCKEDLLGGTNCEITYTFEEPQDIVRVRIAFYKGDERTRVLKIKLNGSSFSVIESSGETDGFEEFELNTDETDTLTLEGLELRGEEWISISEVQFLVL